jgi:hypothetical protein
VLLNFSDLGMSDGVSSLPTCCSYGQVGPAHCPIRKEMKGMASRIWIQVALGLAVLGGGAGCGRSNLVKVQGTVTLDGKPLSWATVTFNPKEGNGRPASGLSDENGNFQLTTSSTNDGAAPGEYKVTVTKEEPGEAAPKHFSDTATMDAMFSKKDPESRRKLADARRKAPALIPRMYADPTRTPFKEVVPPQGPITLALSSKAE